MSGAAKNLLSAMAESMQPYLYLFSDTYGSNTSHCLRERSQRNAVIDTRIYCVLEKSAENGFRPG